MINERIKQLRIEHTLTQQELAEKIGTTLQAISMYERGKRHPDYETLSLLASIFDCSIDFLIGRVNNKKEILTPPGPGQILITKAKNANVSISELEAYIEARKKSQGIVDWCIQYYLFDMYVQTLNALEILYKQLASQAPL